VDRFIRIDIKGHWRGRNHNSTLAMDPEFWGDETNWEEGISCYNITTRGQAEALDELREYWVMHVGDDKLKDYTDKQLTIFDGEDLNTEGSNYEDMAVCHKTFVEMDAVPIMEKVIDIWKKYKECEIDEEKYMDLLKNINLIKEGRMENG